MTTPLNRDKTKIKKATGEEKFKSNPEFTTNKPAPKKPAKVFAQSSKPELKPGRVKA